MSDVFISYRRKDSWIMANLLYEKLCNFGYDVFLDTRDEKMLQMDYEAVIEENLKVAKDHIILISAESFCIRNNDQYIKEIEKTSMSDDVRKIPVIIDDGKNDIYEVLLRCELPCLRKLGNKTITGFTNDAAAFPDTFKRIVSRLTSTPTHKLTVLRSRNEIETACGLKERWQNTEEIYICAHGIESILTQESPFFEQMITEGVKFKIVCVDPESASADYIKNNNIREGTERKRKRVIQNSHDLILDYLDDDRYASQIEYRLTTLHPECVVMIMKRKDGHINNIKVDYIVTSNDSENTAENSLFSKNRRCVYIEETDKSNYDYYCEVFDYIWNHSCTRIIN